MIPTEKVPVSGEFEDIEFNEDFESITPSFIRTHENNLKVISNRNRKK